MRMAVVELVEKRTVRKGKGLSERANQADGSEMRSNSTSALDIDRQLRVQRLARIPMAPISCHWVQDPNGRPVEVAKQIPIKSSLAGKGRCLAICRRPAK